MVMTMVKRPATRTMPISEFRAKCLALMDEVHDTGVTIIVTRRGETVGQLRPLTESERRLFAEGKVEEWKPSRPRQSKARRASR